MRTLPPIPALMPGLLLAVLGACTIERTEPPPSIDVAGAARAEITATLEDYEAAMIEGDVDRIAEFFTADARLQEPDMADIVGRDAIADLMAQFFATGAVTGIDVESEAIDLATGHAWQYGSYEERFRVGNGDEQTVRGRFVIRWQRGPESTWRIQRFFVNHLPAPAADTLNTTD